MRIKILLLVMLSGIHHSIAASYSDPQAANPILPGYFADPSIVQVGEKSYIYATLDPWGGRTLGCWESEDFRNWTYRTLNWPTKELCTSPTSKSANVWAPSVVAGPDGKFHMVVSVGNEVWAGVADQPLGPWRDALGGRPLIPGDFRPGFHMIDAEYFIDDDGLAYLYWGSGLNWKDGRCWVAKLKPDLVTFDGEVKDVTPANYFEAPFMAKRNGLYFLMYSAGNTMKDDYRVHYAVGKSPLGPFAEGPDSPILVTDTKVNIVSPGHHAIFQRGGVDYILYHRHSIPRNPHFMGRQVCVDPLVFTKDGRIKPVVPTHEGPALLQGQRDGQAGVSTGAKASASSEDSPATSAGFVLDGNYATRWAAAHDAKGAWLQLDLGVEKSISRQILRPEYAWKPYRFMVQTSSDGVNWETVADFLKEPATGSPIEIARPVTARYLRLVFPEDVPGSAISFFEWKVQ